LISEVERDQNEQNYYGVVTYQKSAGDLNFQVSAFAAIAVCIYIRI